MAIELDKIPAQTRALWSKLPPGRRWLLALVAAATVGLVAWFGLRGPTESYSVLFSGLQPEDAGRVISELRTMNVPYHVVDGGAAIEVPTAKVHETRITLASAGLPRGGGVGFEVFDKQTFGTTSFVEQMNYRRALQGELSRTISSLDAVERARVHIAIPERSVFAKDEETPSASVVVQLRPGRTLSPGQIKGVINLVASSVEGLHPERVTLVDESGSVLWAGNDSEGIAEQHELERTLSRRVATIVERVVGPGHAEVAVTADLDPAETERTEDNWDKDHSAVRSESHTEEKGTETSDSGGAVAGSRGNLPGTQEPTTGGEGGTNNAHNKVTETKNYEVTHVINHTVAKRARLKRLHVAVLVDAGKDGTARPAAELDRIRSLAKEAAGLEDERGDRIEVHSAPFVKPAEVEPTKPSAWPLPVAPKWIAVAAGAVLLLLLLAVVLLARRRRGGEEPADAVRVAALPMAVRELETMVDSQQARELPGSTARSRAIEAAKGDSVRAARVISSWLSEEKKRTEGKVQS